MNPINNPYNPGAGVPPPELAGRENILKQAENTIARAKIGKPDLRSRFELCNPLPAQDKHTRIIENHTSSRKNSDKKSIYFQLP